jgi:hypothetical protein
MRFVPFRLSILLGCLLWIAAPAAAQEGELIVNVEEFGVGGVYRPGDLAGMRVRITVPQESDLDDATLAWVQWEVPNADGDIGEYGRSWTLTKGRTANIWLYAPLPPDLDSTAVWSVRVFDYAEERRGREIGGARYSPVPTGLIGIETSIIAVVGNTQMGLGQYAFPGGQRGPVVVGNENTRIASGVRPENLPDRWEGLRGLEALVWAEHRPEDLRGPQAEAIVEWVRRGGHLVIVLPETGNPWSLGTPGKIDRSLERMLPARLPQKVEDVPLRSLLPLLVKSDGLDRNVRQIPMTVHVFDDLTSDARVEDNGFEPVMALDDGRVVVVQRIFGHGRVTIVGMSISSTTLGSLPLSNGVRSAVPQADAFWNRILGRRADTPLPGEITDIDEAKRLSRGRPTERKIGTGPLFKDQINMTGEALQGLLLALVLFILYWIVAGPGSYAILKVYQQARHAWLAFAAAAAVFTALAWGGVVLLGLGGVEQAVRHVTFLDYIARPTGSDPGANDPQLARMTSWLSMYLPGYGATAIGIESLPADGLDVPAQRDLLFSWTPPGPRGQRFPNIDRYRVNVGDATDDFAVPTRATATQLYAHHLGGLGSGWGMLRADPADPPRVEIQRTPGAGPDDPGREVLKGSIISDLPGDLTNWTIVWVQNNRQPRRTYARESDAETSWVRLSFSGRSLNNGRMARGAANDLWEPGESFELSGIDIAANALETNIQDRFMEPLAKQGTFTSANAPLRPDEQRRYMEMLSFFRMLTPPQYLKQPTMQNPETVMAMRELGRELDLSDWLARPCIIIIGFLEGTDCPIPLRRAGQPVASEGRTVVRWIYPLPVEPTIAFRSARRAVAGEKDAP